MRIEASAPSNIALIKYMGKTEGGGNRPANSSLSYTLEHLRSFVVLEPHDGPDEWAALEGFPKLDLSAVGLKKYLDHFAGLKQRWNIPGHYRILSANNFPSDCGLASSASSFAALTTAGFELARRHNPDLVFSETELSRLSRSGSGSSCRSFFSPWAKWENEGAEPVDLELQLEHAVLILESDKKLVSSSQAHARVSTSLLWNGRPERAERRLKDLLKAFHDNDWPAAYEVCWSEFWDMHALFETSRPSFGYMTPATFETLDHLRGIWRQEFDGPLVTMDAGANIHLLFRKDQIVNAGKWLADFKTLRSWNE
jgi:diphosphomevalonate decarboxylase